MNPFFVTDFSISDSLKTVRKSVLIYETIINRGMGEPIINYYEYKPNKNLNILKFSEISDEWLDFIAKCRSGKTHIYDIVEGPMANDTVWNYVNDFLSGRINRKQFWALAEFRYPTHQISFHTLSALDCLTFIKSEVIYDSERKK